MPFHIRSKNPLVRVISAVAVGAAWWVVMGPSMVIMILFAGQFDIQAFLTRTEPKNDFEITGFEFILVCVGMLAVHSLYNVLFIRLARFVNRRLKKNVE